MPLSLLAGPANAGKVALLLERYLADARSRSDADRAEPAGRRPRRARTAGAAPARCSAARSAPSTTSSSGSRAGTATHRPVLLERAAHAAPPARRGRRADGSALGALPGFADALGSTLCRARVGAARARRARGRPRASCTRPTARSSTGSASGTATSSGATRPSASAGDLAAWDAAAGLRLRLRGSDRRRVGAAGGARRRGPR